MTADDDSQLCRDVSLFDAQKRTGFVRENVVRAFFSFFSILLVVKRRPSGQRSAIENYIYIYASLIASFLVNLTAFDVVGNNSKKNIFFVITTAREVVN